MLLPGVLGRAGRAWALRASFAPWRCRAGEPRRWTSGAGGGQEEEEEGALGSGDVGGIEWQEVLASATFQRHLAAAEARHAEALRRLNAGEGGPEAARELAKLGPLVDRYARWQRVWTEMRELRELASDASAEAEMRGLAEDELREVEANGEARRLAREIVEGLVPEDPSDEGGCVIEVRGGVGGAEAMIFAGELARMYRALAEHRGWRCEVMEWDEAGDGRERGLRQGVLQVQGAGAHGVLKYESGVHRVQRVPVTESKGRMQTSAASVVVMALVADAGSAYENLPASDLRIDTYRTGGPGGQNANKTDSAVRITHLPTGVVVAMQQEREQRRNMALAMALLKTRLVDAEREAQRQHEQAERRGKMGAGDRSEKIRTYHPSQDRITDHRVGISVSYRALETGDKLDGILAALKTRDIALRIQDIIRASEGRVD